MGVSKFRKAIEAVKDQTSISLAKVGNGATLPDLDVAIVKATSHEEYPAEGRYIREILNLTCYSPLYVASCVTTISQRLTKTKNWVVALKALMLVQRLLHDGGPAYEQEIFFATRRGTRLLNMSDFRATSRSNSWDYSAFVRSYALFLDEELEYKMQGRQQRHVRRHSSFSPEEDDEENARPQGIVARATPVREMKNEQVFSRMHHLMQLFERFLACRPTGAAKHHRMVLAALYPIVKESFELYYDIIETMGVLTDRFEGLTISHAVKVYDIFCRVAKQYDEIDIFYDWCKSVGIASASKYPEVGKISQKKLDVMNEFIREKSAMGQNKKVEGSETGKGVEETTKPHLALKPEPERNPMKSLPGPEEAKEKEKVEVKKTQDIGDLMNLGDDAPTSEQHADKLDLALFNSGSATKAPATTGTSPWEAFNGSGDWETALVQTASHLSHQQPALPGRFNSLVLDEMYEQGSTQASTVNLGMVATGSASSVAFGSVGRPAMLALPTPTSADGGADATPGGDPFASSFAVAPPPCVQLSGMEKQQRLLVEEQMMWQQYQRDGLQRQVGLAKLQSNQYPQNMGCCKHPY